MNHVIAIATSNMTTKHTADSHAKRIANAQSTNCPSEASRKLAENTGHKKLALYTISEVMADTQAINTNTFKSRAFRQMQ